MIAIVGKTCSGKTTLSKHLEENGFLRIPQTTSRPMRDGEKQGVDYNFVTLERFEKGIKDNEFIEYQEYNPVFGKCYYGSRKSDYDKDEHSVVVLNPLVLDKIKKYKPDIFVVYIDVSEQEIFSRLSKRGDNPDEINRRMLSDREDFKNIYKKTDIVIKSDKDISTFVERIILKHEGGKPKKCIIMI